MLLHHVKSDGRSWEESDSCDEISVALPRQTMPSASTSACERSSDLWTGCGAKAPNEEMASIGLLVCEDRRGVRDGEHDFLSVGRGTR